MRGKQGLDRLRLPARRDQSRGQGAPTASDPRSGGRLAIASPANARWCDWALTRRYKARGVGRRSGACPRSLLTGCASGGERWRSRPAPCPDRKDGGLESTHPQDQEEPVRRTDPGTIHRPALTCRRRRCVGRTGPFSPPLRPRPGRLPDPRLRQELRLRTAARSTLGAAATSAERQNHRSEAFRPGVDGAAFGIRTRDLHITRPKVVMLPSAVPCH